MTTTQIHSPATPSLRIRHPSIAGTIDDLHLVLDAPANAGLLIVCGPPGVGKSTLGDYLVESELKVQAGEMEANPGFVPAIRVEAPASGERDFSWRLFYQRILAGLEGDLDCPRTAYGVDSVSGRVVRPHGASGHRLSGLRTALERSLKNRETRFIVVDEAAHMMRQCHGLRLEQQLDTLKSLSNESGVRWVLLGSYDLFELLSLSGQLARRTHVLHFGRYRQDLEADVRAFRACIRQFAQRLPALKEVDVMAYSDLLHENTVGCIGTLWQVLSRLNVQVTARGWSEEQLYRSLLPEAQTTRILEEVLNGEDRIATGLSRTRPPAVPATARRIA